MLERYVKSLYEEFAEHKERLERLVEENVQVDGPESRAVANMRAELKQLGRCSGKCVTMLQVSFDKAASFVIIDCFVKIRDCIHKVAELCTIGHVVEHRRS